MSAELGEEAQFVDFGGPLRPLRQLSLTWLTLPGWLILKAASHSAYDHMWIMDVLLIYDTKCLLV